MQSSFATLCYSVKPLCFHRFEYIMDKNISNHNTYARKISFCVLFEYNTSGRQFDLTATYIPHHSGELLTKHTFQPLQARLGYLLDMGFYCGQMVI